MLKHLTIKNFALIESLELEFADGMTVVSGETGAGKSILIEALELALGGRADSNFVRAGSERCELTLGFDLSELPLAQTWLLEHGLEAGPECLLHRIVMRDGRSRSFVNGLPMPLQRVRELGALLVNIHGQHEYHLLLKREAQRDLLDDYANHPELLQQVAQIYQSLQTLQNTLAQAQSQYKDQTVRSEFLKYQLQELEVLALGEDELTHLDKEHKQLTHVDEFQADCQKALALLSEQEEGNVASWLQHTETLLSHAAANEPKLRNAVELINNAIIQTKEAVEEIKTIADKTEPNPERLAWIEQRLQQIHQTARKYQVPPEQLLLLQTRLIEELAQLVNHDEHLKQWQAEIAQLTKAYQQAAAQLSQSRQVAAKKLAKQVTAMMQKLNLAEGQFAVAFEPIAQPQPYGQERIEFQVSANPGQPLQALAQVASGGELSRLSLAIQVAIAQKRVVPMMIFDEVDVGIGGATAAVVGKLLRQMAQYAQILCVTHLPQVAAAGHHHLQVSKLTKNKQTYTTIRWLNPEEKLHEIARMLSGLKITAQTLAHAKEMLEVE